MNVIIVDEEILMLFFMWIHEGFRSIMLNFMSVVSGDRYVLWFHFFYLAWEMVAEEVAMLFVASH